MLWFFKAIGRGMKRFGTHISTIINTILLSITYLIGVGITAIIAKLVGKRFLTLGPDRKVLDTYWEDLELKKKPTEEYYRQF